MATDNITDKNTLKSWFKRGLKPLETQFHAWMDAYWHKSEKIPTDSIEGLEDVLNSKAEASAVDTLVQELENHKEDSNLHKTETEQGKLDHLADDPDATYATKEDLDATVITVPIDFTKTERERIAEIKAYLNPYIENDKLFKIPMFARYIWNDNDEEDTNITTRSCILQGIPKHSERRSVNEFASPLKIVDSEYPEYAYAITTRIKYFNKKVSVEFTEYSGEFDNNLLLRDDNDGTILGSDGANWMKLLDYLEIGLHPSIYLKTTFSEVYVPASYDFVFIEEGKYTGSIILQYTKTIDGEKQIWIETKSFTQETGCFHGYNSIYQETIEKIPIPDETDAGHLPAETIIFPIDFRVNKEAMENIVQDYYASLLKKEVMFNQPIYADFIWYQDPEHPNTSPVCSKLIMCEHPQFILPDFQNLVGLKAYLPVSIKIPSDLSEKCRKIELYALRNGENAFVGLSVDSYFPVSVNNFNLVFIPDNIFSFDDFKDQFGKDITGTLTEHIWGTLVKCDRWTDLFNYIQETRQLPPIALRTILSDMDFVFRPATVVPKGVVTVSGLELKTSSIKIIDNIRYIADETLVIPEFKGVGSSYTYRVNITRCYPEVKLVGEYPADLTNYPDGTIFIKEQEAS